MRSIGIRQAGSYRVSTVLVPVVSVTVPCVSPLVCHVPAVFGDAGV
jgi:hypothetical protein